MQISRALSRPAWSRALSKATWPRALSTSSSASPATVILGTGWGGYNLAKSLASPSNPITIISPSNHFLFTPLLPSTTVGTLEFRAVQETIKASSFSQHATFYQAKARTIDFSRQLIECEGIFDKEKFFVPYGKLVMAQGVKTNTFNTPNVADREGKEIFYLKHLHHARGIRNRTLELFEMAAYPTTGEAERRRLLSFVVVGAGPTSCEYASELNDFIQDDISKMYPELMEYTSIHLVEAGDQILGPFDQSLRDYISRLFTSRSIEVMTGTAVTAVETFENPKYLHEGTRAVLSNGESIEFGLMVWSAGLAPVKFSDRIEGVEKTRAGRIVVDEYLRVKGHEGTVWAIGDAAEVQGNPLPQLAQVAQQQGEYLGKVLSGGQGESEAAWNYFSLGSMMSAGFGEGIYDGSGIGNPKGWQVSLPFNMRGFVAWISWRSAYWGKQVSTQNKILIPMYWFKAWLFGRDVSRF